MTIIVFLANCKLVAVPHKDNIVLVVICTCWCLLIFSPNTSTYFSIRTCSITYDLVSLPNKNSVVLLRIHCHFLLPLMLFCIIESQKVYTTLMSMAVITSDARYGRAKELTQLIWLNKEGSQRPLQEYRTFSTVRIYENIFYQGVR